jgi:hypothetical protein
MYLTSFNLRAKKSQFIPHVCRYVFIAFYSYYWPWCEYTGVSYVSSSSDARKSRNLRCADANFFTRFTVNLYITCRQSANVCCYRICNARLPRTPYKDVVSVR